MGEKMSELTNSLNWFEIPVSDTTRAQNFYEQAFAIKLFPMDMMGMQMIMFPTRAEGGNVGGALVKSDMHKPSAEGSLIYLNGNPDLQHILDRIPSAGGKVKMPKTKISDDVGFMAFFEDSEGNTVGLHSNS